MATILVIDDERMLGELLGAMLSRWGHAVCLAPSGREGLKRFRRDRPDATSHLESSESG